MVTLYVGFAIVEVWEPSLQLAFLVICGLHWINNLSLKDRVHADLYHQLKVFYRVVSRSQSRNWNIQGWGIQSWHIWRSHTIWYRSYFSKTLKVLRKAENNWAWWNIFSRAYTSYYFCGAWYNLFNWTSPNKLADL